MTSLVFTTSCDDKVTDIVEDVTDPIVGVWTIDTAIISYSIDGIDFIDYMIEVFISYGLTQEQAEAQVATKFNLPGTFDDIKGTFEYEFKEDGTFFIRSDAQEQSGTWSLELDILSTNLMFENNMVTGIFNVTTLNASTLVLESSSDSSKEDYNGDGIDEVMVISVSYKFTR